MTTTRTHTYSDGSQIELGGTPGKGRVDRLKTGKARKLTGRKSERVTPDQTTRPDQDF